MPQIQAKASLCSKLPKLRITHHTQSCALHKIRFLGSIEEWPNFEREVLQYFRAKPTWSRSVVGYALGSTSADLNRERVLVGDETGLQGRFQQSVGQVVGAALEAEGIMARFGDFKSSGRTYHRVPDIAILDESPTNNSQVLAVGEIKVPWVETHDLAEAVESDILESILAQAIRYMLELKLKYGFIPNYQQTIFLRQELVSGAWIIQHSPVIDSGNLYGESMQTYRPSLKMCFFFLSHISSLNSTVANNGPFSPWFYVTG